MSRTLPRGRWRGHESAGARGWRKLKARHCAVESEINSLEHHGLDRCPDKGLNGYKRYVGFGILAYNLHKVGTALLDVTARMRRKKKAA